MVRRDWPGEVPRDRVLGNFRKTRAERAVEAKPRSWREKRTGMSAEHLARIRLLPCCVCPENRDIQAHHLKSGVASKFRGVSLKAPDMFAVPLCALHHEEVERRGSRRELEWFQSKRLMDPYALADGLWNATRRGLAPMRAVRDAHMQAAIIEAARRLRTALGSRKVSEAQL